MRLFFEPGDESAHSLECHVEIIHAEEQEESVARCCMVRAHQRGMLVRTPLVEAEQDGSIRIQDLTKVVMHRRRLGLAEERLVPFEAAGNVSDPDDRPCAFHRVSAVGLTKVSLQPILSPSREKIRGQPTQVTCPHSEPVGLTIISGVDALVGAGITSHLVRAGKGDDPPRWTRSNNVRWQGYPFAWSLF